VTKDQQTIFVSIANYRDTEITPTIEDLFAQAAHPQRIRVGVLSQVMPGVDDDCLAPEHPQVRQMCVQASASLGPCWARHRILTELRGDEQWFLQIDSHTRFAQDWDQRFIQMHARLASPRSVLTCHPVPYEPPRKLHAPIIPVTKPKEFNEHGVLMVNSRSVAYEQRPVEPIPCALVGAGCLFAPIRAFDEVPYDPHLYFHGEEVTLSARLWTHGWDLYAPNDVLIYHDYTHDRGRPKHWRDNRDWPSMNARSFARVRHLLSGEVCNDPEAVLQIDRYGLGDARPLKEYARLCGVDFNQKIVLPSG
jgi:hypothetical protein